MLYEIRPVAVNLEPCQRVVQHMPMEQCALRPERRANVHEPRLQREDLVQPFDVSPWHRQHAEFDAPLERIG